MLGEREVTNFQLGSVAALLPGLQRGNFHIQVFDQTCDGPASNNVLIELDRFIQVFSYVFSGACERLLM